MSGRWAGSGRRRQLPQDWPQTRRRILRRDGYRCTEILDGGRRCGRRANHVDHVVPHHLGGSDDDENLASLCATHHGVKSSREGIDAARVARARAKRAPVKHPGLV